jgi:hypothetical protein
MDKETDTAMNPILKKALERSVPVCTAYFHSAVNNSDDIPENNFSRDSHAKSRKVKMWWIFGDGLLCFQKDKYWIVPSSNVKFSKFE